MSKKKNKTPVWQVLAILEASRKKWEAEVNRETPDLPCRHCPVPELHGPTL